ncbi:MAG: cyclic nucleotide-binding domain-containing protein [Deltaproteobacteria bacterium]|nr:cyclic nucleotide-binding domain-containing protein [Deltaproteobacteria bacterium]
MLEKTLKDPKLQAFSKDFNIGSNIFVEGESSQDLYILVSGKLDVLKGNKKMTDISKSGSLFGEMSFLLGDKRTATIKAASKVKTICIPKDQISLFLIEFPDVSREITKLLAERLDETSQMLYGLKEFSDQLPDAVILADSKNKILTCNKSAEELYGKKSDSLKNKPVEHIYDEPGKYKEYINEVRSENTVREKILRIQHPEKGARYISTSTTLLYDGRNEFQGTLSIGRDVTAVEKLKIKYKRSRFWLIPFLILFAGMLSAIFYGYPYFTKGYEEKGNKNLELRNIIAKDYFLMKSLLLEPFANRDIDKTSSIMKDFFSAQMNETIPYLGIILLNNEKKVFNAHMTNPDIDVSKIIGSSYSGIEFNQIKGSSHCLLSLYRVSKDRPMGKKCIEIAFELYSKKDALGWIIFHMDMDFINKKYKTGEANLQEFEFKYNVR